jgi:hypothetical protein
MSMPVGRKGNYRLVAKLTRAPDYAIVQLSLDGKKLGGPIDLYGPSVEPVPPIVLGARGLAEGQHQLAVEIVGVNPNAAKAHIFGLDYLRLQRLR